jgi:hypothetical protein
MSRCRHNRTREATYCYSGPVSRRENPVAHGGVCFVETCLTCGAVKRTNSNGGQLERGPWTNDSDASRA